MDENLVTELCHSQGLDPLCKRARAKASYSEKKRENATWLAEAKEHYHECSDLPTSVSTQKLPEESQLAYVRRFSSINITTNQSLLRPDRASKIADISGNSRDAPTSFETKCQNSGEGCIYKSGSVQLLQVHESTCKVGQPLKEYAFPCDIEGCSSGFGTQKRLDAHRKEYHDWIPRECPRCNLSTTFDTSLEYRKHIRDAHSGFCPTACLFPHCQPKTTFQLSKVYLHHLTKVHRLVGKERDAFLQKEIGEVEGVGVRDREE